jgi:hypothetical protein
MASTLPTFSDLSNTTINVYTVESAAGTITGLEVVDDLDALRAVAASPANKIAIVRDMGDGNVGVYAWVAGATAAESGYYIVAPSSGMAGRWYRGI